MRILAIIMFLAGSAFADYEVIKDTHSYTVKERVPTKAMTAVKEAEKLSEDAKISYIEGELKKDLDAISERRLKAKLKVYKIEKRTKARKNTGAINLRNID